jgi:hypothetical protein
VRHIAGRVDFETEEIPAHFKSHFGKSAEKRSYLDMRARITLAGTIAHDIAEPGRRHDVGDEMDDAIAMEFFSETWDCDDDERAAIIAQLTREMRTILLQSWDKVERIVGALMREEELSAAQLRNLFQDQPPTAI